jgi:hypothetical protein
MAPMIQVGGALLVLAGFILAQVGIVRTTSLAYLALNLVGSFVLAVDASIHGQWGFLLLEAVWAVVSAIGLVRAVMVVTGAGRLVRDPDRGSTGDGASTATFP